MAKDMKIWKGNGNTTTLLFSMKGLEMRTSEHHNDRTPTEFSTTSPDLLKISIPITTTILI